MKRRIQRALHFFSLHTQKNPVSQGDPRADLMKQKLDVLALPEHVVQVLNREGIYSIQDVVLRKSGNWEGICNFTQGDFDALVGALRKKGIRYDVVFDPQKYNFIRQQWEKKNSFITTSGPVHKKAGPHTFVKKTGLSKEVLDRLKQILTGDFYFIKEIQDVFMDEFPEEHVWKLDSYAISQLGFITEDKYAVAKHFGSAAAYFAALLEQDVADFRDKPYLLKIPLFSQILKHKKRALDSIEVEPMVFWSIQHLMKLGISKPEMRVFRNRVDVRTAEEEYFTIFSLRKSGFSFPWAEKGLGDYFYSSVLLEGRPRFRYIQFGEKRLIRNSLQHFTVNDFLYSLMKHADSPIEFQDLVVYIKEQYGCCSSDKKLKRIISKDQKLSPKVELY